MILEAMNLMKECPTGFVVQSTFDDKSLPRRLVSHVPLLGRLVIKGAIKNGEIYLRPEKVDPKLPEFYVLKGWHVRNLSQRKDPLSLNKNGVPLRHSRFKLKHW